MGSNDDRHALGGIKVRLQKLSMNVWQWRLYDHDEEVCRGSRVGKDVAWQAGHAAKEEYKGRVVESQQRLMDASRKENSWRDHNDLFLGKAIREAKA